VLQQLEGGPPSGRDEVDPVFDPEGVDGGGTVSTANHCKSGAVGHRMCHPGRPGAETVVLEDTHGTIPQHRAGIGDHLGVGLNGGGPDIESHPPFGNVVAGDEDFALVASTPEGGAGLKGDDVGGEENRGSGRQQRRTLLDSIVVHHGGSDVVSRRGQERERHTAPDQ